MNKADPLGSLKRRPKQSRAIRPRFSASPVLLRVDDRERISDILLHGAEVAERQPAHSALKFRIFAGYDTRPEGDVRLAFRAGDEAGNRDVARLVLVLEGSLRYAGK